MPRLVATRTNVQRLSIDDRAIRAQASAVAGAQLRQRCTPRARERDVGFVDGRRTGAEDGVGPAVEPVDGHRNRSFWLVGLSVGLSLNARSTQLMAINLVPSLSPPQLPEWTNGLADRFLATPFQFSLATNYDFSATTATTSTTMTTTATTTTATTATLRTTTTAMTMLTTTATTQNTDQTFFLFFQKVKIQLFLAFNFSNL